MKTVKIGFAPTRRSIFSAPDAIKFADLTRQRLRELNVEFVDIKDINKEGLLYQECDRIEIEKKFRAAGIDGLFLPHGNFGTEYECARLAKAMGVPVLLWGPRDERPEPNGVRLRDTQCGLFATGKVLRRFGVPFTYMTNCRLTDPEFARGIQTFLAVCSVVRTFRSIRILQIAPRPYDFWSTMCNEGELLEKFNVQLAPIPMPELTAEMKRVKAEGSVWEAAMSATQYGLDNLCAIVDRNHLQISGSTEEVMHQDSLRQRWEAFGWNVITAYGHDYRAIKKVFAEARACKGKPTLLIAETIKGYGSAVMENKVSWHHHVPTKEEYTQILADFAARKEDAFHE